MRSWMCVLLDLNCKRSAMAGAVLVMSLAVGSARAQMPVDSGDPQPGEPDETEIIPPADPLPPAGPLALTCPEDLTVPACGSGPVLVSYPEPGVLGDCASSTRITCTPPAGSVFAPGRTVIECVGSNDCRERATCSFVVNVAPDAAPPAV